MKLSALQKYVLMECFAADEKILRGKLLNYYYNKKKKPGKKDQMDIISKSLNRLIDKGMVVGYGKRTAEKWFFTFIKLTPKGKAKARQIYREKQQKLF